MACHDLKKTFLNDSSASSAFFASAVFTFKKLTRQIRAVRSDRSAPAPHAAETQKKRLCVVLCAALCFVAQVPHVECLHPLKFALTADKYSTK